VSAVQRFKKEKLAFFPLAPSRWPRASAVSRSQATLTTGRDVAQLDKASATATIQPRRFMESST
jgi:hypothetical protein